MAIDHECRIGGGSSRIKKLFAASAAALIVSAGLAASSSALPTGPGVRDGKNITVAHNIDFVAVFGYTVGDPMTVEVFRNGVKIGTASGPAQSTADGGGLEVNHGPVGAPQPGDCWENITPDIIPGDRIVVTGDGGTDEILVDDILITNDPVDDTTTADPSDVYVEGHASYADGTPIPVDQLNSGEIRAGSRFRASPTEVVRTPGTTDGFRAIYKDPYNIERNRDGIDPKKAILNGDHAMGYGHVAPTPPESQLVEGVGNNANGPALGCEGSPQEANAVATSDDEAVNLTSGDLVLGGIAMADTTAVTGTVSDETGGSVPFDATASLSTNPGQKSWSATIDRADLRRLADGTLTVAGQYTGPGGAIGGRELEVLKDTVAPGRPTATPGGGRYERVQRVTLNAENGASIHYTVNGSRPSANSRLFGSPIPVTSNQTIRSIAVDAAGNPSQVAGFRYTILKKSSVSLNLRSSNLKLGQSELIRGRVAPAHPGKTVRVKITRTGRDLVKNVKVRPNSTYVFRYKPNRAGRHFAKVRFAGDADHSASTSIRKSFRVRR